MSPFSRSTPAGPSGGSPPLPPAPPQVDLSLRWAQLARAADFDPRAPVLVALSGGADSVLLLATARGAREAPPLWAAHVDHGLRGDESRADADFCRRLCRELDVPLAVLPAPVDGAAADLEARARAARYRALAAEARRVGAPRVATGHHADDELETLLLRWLRGTHLTGLAGLRRRTVLTGFDEGRADGDPAVEVVRPLLGLRREEVRALLEARGLPWREDSSNADRRFARNRVRHDLLPSLDRLGGPGAVENLRAFGRAVAELEERCARATAHLAWLPPRHAPATRGRDDARWGGSLARHELRRLAAPLRRRALWRLLVEGTGEAPRRRVLERVLDDVSSGRCTRHALPGGWSLQLRAATLELHPPAALLPDSTPSGPGEGTAPDRLPFPGTFRVRAPRAGAPRAGGPPTAWSAPLPTHAAGCALAVPGRIELPDGRGLRAELVELRPGAPVPRDPVEVELDADGLPSSLWVRTIAAGDRFHALGAPGSRPLRRFLADAGIAREDRARVPLVFAGSELVWVAGVRPGHARRVRGATRLRLRLRLEDAARS